MLIFDFIFLIGFFVLNINEDGYVVIDLLIVDNSIVIIFDEVFVGWVVGDVVLYVNNIKVINDGILDVGNIVVNVLQVDILNLISIIDISGNIYVGVFNIESNCFVFDVDLINDCINDIIKLNYGYGLIVMNFDGYLIINGNGDNDNIVFIEVGQNEVDNNGDYVVVVIGNYKVCIDNVIGVGFIVDYNGNELIYVNDKNSNVIFFVVNKVDLGVYIYQVEQCGNIVVL